MPKYIDADALSESVNELIGRRGAEKGMKSACLFTLTMLANAPAADVAPVRRAHWKEFNSCAAECSKCGGTVSNERLWKKRYCPECGAKMDA